MMEQTKEDSTQPQELGKELDRLSEELRHTYQEINLLYAISEKLGGETDLGEITRVILEEVGAQIPTRRASIMLFEPVHQELMVMAAKGLPPELGRHPSVKLGESILQEVINGRKPLLVNDLRDLPHLAGYMKEKGYETFSMLSVPFLSARGKVEPEVLGTINLSDKTGEQELFTPRDQKLLSAIASQTAIAITRTHLLEDLRRSEKEIEGAFFYLVQTLARAAESNDEVTGNHIIRVGRYSQTIAEILGMPGEFGRQIFYFAQMHDVGKIHIHPDILQKPGKLTEQEWAIITTHCQEGANIIGNAPMLSMAREIALSHHESWDGTGYPWKLKKEKISLAGRITKMADIYDALRDTRPYKPAFDHKKTCAIITKGEGRLLPTHFDPQVLDAFKKAQGVFEQIFEELKG